MWIQNYDYNYNLDYNLQCAINHKIVKYKILNVNFREICENVNFYVYFGEAHNNQQCTVEPS